VQLYKIFFPDNVKTNWLGFNQIISQFHRYLDLSNSIIEIDFNNVNFFDANFAAILGVYIEKFEERNNTIIFKNFNTKVEQVLRRNQFLIQFGFASLADKFETCVPYKKFRNADSEGFQQYIEADLIGKPTFPKMSEELGPKMVESIYEIYVNAITHGQCHYIHTCGQIFKRSPSIPLQFCIVDSGKNIKENVSEHFGVEISATKAIEWAMQLGNTTKTHLSGGLGLGLIFDFIKLNKGTLQVVSSDGFYEYKGGTVSTLPLLSPFLGTIVNLTINLEDTNSYILA
jgi:anti-anti-sigma regulatory factor